MGIAKFDKGYAEQMESMTGYTMFTTFWDDFAIAERMGIIVQNGQYVRTDVNRGIVAIEDTFNRAFKEWKTNYKYLTELVMVLSWKSSPAEETLNRWAEMLRPHVKELGIR